ncbi:isochorismatase family cysteine hydrolase [Spiroplasma endosymbiont of Polydrusus pterygomalis]|uniref:isochorismatase family cysteine hydrolase n=1 Tax=Spiroplasma endosymbiont of Polydrusus pterygomalis TaxID=3139327 RepID=UPI003CCB721D
MKGNNTFIKTINKTLDNTINLNFKNLKGHNIIFIVDMVNGFAKYGNLFSSNIKSLIKPIKGLLAKVNTNETKVIAFNDAHNEHSPEFHTFPSHCLENTSESQLVAELQSNNIKIIKKNSTNGFFAFDFKPNLQWDNIIIVGCCTDICVYQFAVSCKTWFNQHNKEVNVIVPMSMTNTYDEKEHSATILNQYAWYSMIKNGITVVKDIV